MLIDELQAAYEINDGDTPLILIELSKNEWREQQPYSVHLSNLSIYNEHESNSKCYNNVAYENVKIGNKMLKDGKYDGNKAVERKCYMKDTDISFIIDEFLVDRMSKRKVLFTTTKDDAKKMNERIIFTTTSNQISIDTQNFKSSGIVLLAVVKCSSEKSQYTWEQSLFSMIETCKPNIITLTLSFLPSNLLLIK